MHNSKSKTFICVANPKWKTSVAGKLNKKQKQKLEVKMKETNPKMKKKESKRRKQVGEEMTETEEAGFKLVRT